MTLADPHASLLATMFAALESDGIAHALLRDHPPARESGDLDLLVWPEDRDRFVEVVEGLGFRSERRRLPRKEVFYAWHRGRLHVLDVHYALIQGGLVYLALPPRESVVGHGPPRLAPVDELLHLVFHELLGKGGIRPERIDRIRELVEDGAALNVASRLANRRIRSAVEGVMAEPAEYPPGSILADEVARRLRALLLLRPSNIWHRTMREALVRLRPHRGCLVAFLGVDGAGKSTTLDAVARELRATGRVPHTTTYLGPWGHVRTRALKGAYRWGLMPPMQDWLKRLRDRMRGEESAPPVLRCVVKWAKGRVRGYGYYGAVYYELARRYLDDVRPALRRGKVVLADRYIYDLRHLHQNRPMTLFSWTRQIITRCYPRPDLVVFLYADPEAITARKPQLTSAEITLLQDIYREALAGLPVIEVNTDEPVEVVTDRVVSRITEQYFERR